MSAAQLLRHSRKVCVHVPPPFYGYKCVRSVRSYAGNRADASSSRVVHVDGLCKWGANSNLWIFFSPGCCAVVIRAPITHGHGRAYVRMHSVTNHAVRSVLHVCVLTCTRSGWLIFFCSLSCHKLEIPSCFVPPPPQKKVGWRISLDCKVEVLQLSWH